MAEYFTKEGLEKLKKELKEMKTTEMKKIVKLIAEAASFGDLKENAAYHDARDRKSFLLGRIEQLEFSINDAIIVEKEESGKVQVGSEVLILFGGKKEKYILVTSSEADILINKISYQSPLGSQLINKKVGDEFNYEIKNKSVKVKILEVH